MGLLDKLFGKKQETPAGVTITYRTAMNETCRSIAKKFYGDESEWERIYKPNEWRLKDEVQSGSDKLLPGTELTIKDPKFDERGQPITAGAAT
jgi:nucleoid-associated protein YgaU